LIKGEIMAESRIETDLYVNGHLRSQTFTPPVASITNVSIVAGAGIEASKLQHQHALDYKQGDGSDIVAAIVPLHVVRGATGLVIDVEVVAQTAPTGGDLAFTVDVQTASEASPSPVSVLSSVITVDATKADYEVVSGTISNADLAVDETILVVIAVSGSTGSQGQGLIVTITIREDAD